MATTNQIVGGRFQDAVGTLVSNGYMIFSLSQDAVTPDGAQIVSGFEVRVNLDADGSIPDQPNQQIWPNDVLSPSGTFYNVSVYTPAGQLVWGPNAQQVLSTTVPFDIGLWVPAAVNTGAGGGSGGGTGTVTSVGLTMPTSVFAAPVAGSPIQIAGTLSPTFINQTQSSVFCAPSTSDGVPSFRRITQDDILPGFAISSFSGGSTVEIGASVVNPTFTAIYSSTPTSAQITNTDGTDSPHFLSSPFTSVTVSGTFRKTDELSTVFTLTAVGSSTQSANQSILWQPRTFGGVGTAGATSASSSGNNATLNNGSTLANAGLVAGTGVGKVYGPYTAANQKIYLLLRGGFHTFKDNSTGFAFVFNTPTAVNFVNQNGVTVLMYLYESTNYLTGSFSILEAT